MPTDPAVRPLVASSIELIQRHQAPTGAYIAAPGYGTYAYSWLRDGAFVAAAMDCHGYHDSAASFHRWAAETIERHADKVERLDAETRIALQGTGDPFNPMDDRYVLHTRFTIDGDEGNSHWGNFQLDGYGFWLTSIAQHLEITESDPAPYLEAMSLVRRYLTLTRQQRCYDCWEEYPTRRHTTTWAAVARGLLLSGRRFSDPAAVATAEAMTRQLLNHAAASDPLFKFAPGSETEPTLTTPDERRSDNAAVAGHERIGHTLDPNTIDGSILLVLSSFGPFPTTHRIVSNTLERVENELVVGSGVHRYLQDEYYGGGLWIVLAGALAAAQAAYDPDRANEILDWIETQADADGHLAEQTDSHLRKPESLQPWIKRWGPPAKPLLWSHAMYLLGVAAIGPGNPNPSGALPR